MSDVRVRRMACEHCGARAWVDGQCLRCGKPASEAGEPVSAADDSAASTALLSRPAVLIMATLVVIGMLALGIPTVLGLVTPEPVALFVLIMLGFVVLAKLRPKRRKTVS